MAINLSLPSPEIRERRLNAILSYIQERKADVAIEELNKMFVTNTFVIRNGIKQSIDVKDVVVGDIIELEA